MKRKTVSISLIALLMALAGCEGKTSESAKPSESTPDTVETPATEKSEPPVTSDTTPDTDTEQESASDSEEEEEPEELEDSTEAEILAKLKEFANSKSYAMDFEINGTKYRDVVTDRYIYHDQTKSGYVLYDSFDPSKTSNYEKIIYSYNIDENGNCIMGMPYRYNLGYAQYYLKDFNMFYTLHTFLTSTYSNALTEGSLTDSSSAMPGKWLVNNNSSGNYLFQVLSKTMSGYNQVINYEFHLYTDGSLHVELLHYKVDENGNAVTDEDNNRIIESIATFIFTDIDKATKMEVEERFPDKGVIDHYTPKEFSMLLKKPLTLDATMTLVDKTGVEKTTFAGKSEVNLSKDAEEYLTFNENGKVTDKSQYYNTNGKVTSKKLVANNTIKETTLKSSGKDMVWADTATDFSFLATSNALAYEPNDPTCLTYLNPGNAASVLDNMCTFYLSYGLYGDVTSLKFYKNGAGVIDTVKAVLSDGGGGSMKSQFHYEIEIKLSEGKEIKPDSPLEGEEGTKEKFEKAFAKLDGTHNVAIKSGTKRSEGADYTYNGEKVLSVEGNDALDSFVSFTYNGTNVSDYSGYKKDGDKGYIPFKKLKSNTDCRATGASLTEYSFKDALGFDLSADVMRKNEDGTYSIDAAIDHDSLTNYTPFDSVYSAGDTLKIQLNEAEDAIERVTYTTSSWGTLYYVFDFSYGDDAVIDEDYQDGINALTAFKKPTVWSEYFDWAKDLTISQTSSYYTDFIKYFRFAQDKQYTNTEDDARRTVEEAEAFIDEIPFVWYDRLSKDYFSISFSNYSSFNTTKDGVEGKAKWASVYVSPSGTSDEKKAFYQDYTKALVAKGFKLLSIGQEKLTYNSHLNKSNTKYNQYYNEDKKLLVEVAENMSQAMYITEMVDDMYSFTPNK